MATLEKHYLVRFTRKTGKINLIMESLILSRVTHRVTERGSLIAPSTCTLYNGNTPKIVPPV